MFVCRGCIPKRKSQILNCGPEDTARRAGSPGALTVAAESSLPPILFQSIQDQFLDFPPANQDVLGDRFPPLVEWCSAFESAPSISVGAISAVVFPYRPDAIRPADCCQTLRHSI